MGEEEGSWARLTEGQRGLVRDNLGLVAVHLRRNVAGLTHRKHGREWEDLFQEGCLGLIRAARAFRAERRIPFAAFALPRIHNAVSRALQTKFDIIYVPPRRAGAAPRHDAACAAVRRVHEPWAPTAGQTSADLDAREASRRSGDSASERRPTVGQRLREKYERAVREAARSVSGRACRRRDRGRLVRVLVDERFLVPEEDSRRPLRHIARETRSSYGRVAECGRQLNEEIRRTLGADPEFCALRRLSKTDPVGMELSIDEDLERQLAQFSAVEFTRRFCKAPPHERARMLQRLLEMSPEDFEPFVRTRILTLPAEAREQLFCRP